MPIVFGGTQGSLARELAAYPRSALDRFVSACGAPVPRKHADACDTAAKLLIEGEPVRRLVADLPRRTRTIASLVAVMANRMDSAMLEEFSTDRGVATADELKRDLGRLAEAGLVVVERWGSLLVLPGLVRATAELSAAELARITPDHPRSLPLRFMVAALVSIIAEDPPRLTRDGRPHARWSAKMEERLRMPAASPDLIRRAFRAAVLLDIVESTREEPDSRLVPVAARADDVFSLVPEPLALLLASTSEDTRCAPAILARAFAASRGGAATFAQVQKASDEFFALDWFTRTEFGNGSAMNLFELAELLADAESAGLANLTRGDQLTTVSPPNHEPSTARWTVLPNFRVLAPADVDPGALCRLGMIARVERIDHVAEYSLDRQSVARRGRYGLTKSAIEILEERSAFAIPEVVRREVASWDVAPPAVTAWSGDVFVVDSPSHAEALRSLPLPLREIAPGVFFADDRTAARARNAIRKHGIVLRVGARPHGDDGPDGDEGGGGSIDDRVLRLDDALRRVLEAVPQERRLHPEAAETDAVHSARAVTASEAAAAAAAASATPPSPGAPGASAAPEVSGVTKPQQANRKRAARAKSADAVASELVAMFPRVFATCAGNDDLLRRALSLSPAALREAERGRDGTAIARLVHLHSIQRRDEQRTQAAAPRAMTPASTKSAPGAPTTAAAAASAPTSAEAGASAPGRSGSRTRKPAASGTPAFRPAPPGELRTLLEAAAARGADVTVLYTSKDGAARSRTIIPLTVKAVRDVVWVEATEPALGDSVASFRLDRMSAIQG